MLSNLTPDQVKKLEYIVNDGIRVLEKIKLERSALNEAIKAIATDFGVKPKVIRKVISVAAKMNYSEEQEEFDAISEALRKVGRAV